MRFAAFLVAGVTIAALTSAGCGSQGPTTRASTSSGSRTGASVGTVDTQTSPPNTATQSSGEDTRNGVDFGSAKSVAEAVFDSTGAGAYKPTFDPALSYSLMVGSCRSSYTRSQWAAHEQRARAAARRIIESLRSESGSPAVRAAARALVSDLEEPVRAVQAIDRNTQAVYALDNIPAGVQNVFVKIAYASGEIVNSQHDVELERVGDRWEWSGCPFQHD